MKWNWCEMCRFDGHCENQDRNMECACYAREQTLRAEQYENLIDKQQEQLNKLGEKVLSMIDLLQKCYFYLSAAKDCKLTLEHCGNIGILCDLIEKQFKELEK